MFLYDKSGHSFSPKACPTNFNTRSFQIRNALWHLRKPFKQLVLAVTFCVMGAATSSATDCPPTDPTTTPTTTFKTPIESALEGRRFPFENS